MTSTSSSCIDTSPDCLQAEMKEHAEKETWKAVIRNHLAVLCDSIGKMKCDPFKFQLQPGTDPVRQRAYPLSLVKKDALFKMIQVLL